MVAIVEQRRRSFHIHVIKASEVKVWVRIEEAKIGSSGRHKRRGHLGMTGHCEVPIVGGLVIRAIGCDGQRTILLRVVDCITKQTRGIACCVVTKDGQSCHGQTTIADAVPIAISARGPPTIAGGIPLENTKTGRKTIQIQGEKNLRLLIGGPKIV